VLHGRQQHAQRFACRIGRQSLAHEPIAAFAERVLVCRAPPMAWIFVVPGSGACRVAWVTNNTLNVSRAGSGALNPMHCRKAHPFCGCETCGLRSALSAAWRMRRIRIVVRNAKQTAA
jgi:hypothetical protein